MTLRKQLLRRKLRSRTARRTNSINEESKPNDESPAKSAATKASTPPREHETTQLNTKPPTPCSDTDRDTDLSQDSVNGILPENEPDSACCSNHKSRCGFPDAIHDSLLFVGKKLYDCLGDPNEGTRDYMVGVSELGEEGVSVEDATFCCAGMCGGTMEGKNGRRKGKTKVKK